MGEMRVLTVRQPWAWAIIHGGKDVENRVRNIAGSYRGPVAIHAGMRPDDQGWVNAEAYRLTTKMHLRKHGVLGAIIGVVDLSGAHEGHNTERERMESVQSCYRPGKPFGPCSSWALPDNWHLELANPRPLATPIPFKGALGLRKLDPGTIARINEQVV